MRPSLRREFARSLTVAWLVATIGGTSVAVVAYSIFRNMLGLIMLPLILPGAVALSMPIFVSVLLVVVLFPRLIFRHRIFVCGGLPIAMALSSWWPGGFTSFPFGATFTAYCATFDAVVAGWWWYHFTGHLDDPA